MQDMVEELVQRGLSLMPEDRARLAERLLDSIHEPSSPGIEAAWSEEIERRVAAYRRGEEPALQAAIVKDLGTLYEQEIPEVLRLLLDAEPDTMSPSPYVVALAETMLRSPSCTIRGGTTEILRGIIARGIGSR